MTENNEDQTYNLTEKGYVVTRLAQEVLQDDWELSLAVVEAIWKLKEEYRGTLRS